MARKKHKLALPVAIGGFDPAPERALSKQSPYFDKPWQPGQIPGGTGSLIKVIRPSNAPRCAYGEYMAIERPSVRGIGKPDEGKA